MPGEHQWALSIQLRQLSLDKEKPPCTMRQGAKLFQEKIHLPLEKKKRRRKKKTIAFGGLNALEVS